MTKPIRTMAELLAAQKAGALPAATIVVDNDSIYLRADDEDGFDEAYELLDLEQENPQDALVELLVALGFQAAAP